jgi:hypothetical protein
MSNWTKFSFAVLIIAFAGGPAAAQSSSYQGERAPRSKPAPQYDTRTEAGTTNPSQREKSPSQKNYDALRDVGKTGSNR